MHVKFPPKIDLILRSITPVVNPAHWLFSIARSTYGGTKLPCHPQLYHRWQPSPRQPSKPGGHWSLNTNTSLHTQPLPVLSIPWHRQWRGGYFTTHLLTRVCELLIDADAHASNKGFVVCCSSSIWTSWLPRSCCYSLKKLDTQLHKTPDPHI
jgi:hypothetical protein